jgi:hypothetical protein
MATAYQSAEDALNLARSLVNDAYIAGGYILTDAAIATFPQLNQAYVWLQDELINNGIETFVREAVLTPLGADTSTDPNTLVSLTDNGYFDGVTQNAAPQLPVDLLVPLRLWERQTGTTQNFVEMRPSNDGIPNSTPQGRFRLWEWRTDGIYMRGCNQTNDLKIRYDARLPELKVGTDPILIRGSYHILANLLAAQYANSRGSALAANFSAAADSMIVQMCIRSSRKNQRGMHRKRPYRQCVW